MTKLVTNEKGQVIFLAEMVKWSKWSNTRQWVLADKLFEYV